MGIKGLHPMLAKAIKRRHLSELKGWTALVDISGWIYRGMGGKNGMGVAGIVPFIRGRMVMLQSYGIHPIGIFDGPTPPAKQETVNERIAVRQQANAPTRELGDLSAVTKNIQNQLTKLNIPSIHGPYEADGQIAFLSNNGVAHFVISEDSDMVVLGCRRVLFKLNGEGYGDFFDMEDLSLCFQKEPHLFDFMRFRMMCILMGCDYLKNIRGIGPSRVKRLMDNTHSIEISDIISQIPDLLNDNYEIPVNYLERFTQADQMFQHQIVYDPFGRIRKHITPLPNNLKNADMSFAGDLMAGKDEKTLALALGNTTLEKAANLPGSFWSITFIKPQLPQMCPKDGKAYEKPPRVVPKCEVCGKNFKKSGDLTRHKRSHSGEKPYPCLICGVAFAQSSNLTKHHRIHTGVRKYKCTIDGCEAAFTQSSGLTQHKRIHTKEKPFKCTYCEAAFAGAGDLTVHIRTHTGQKPYKCTWEGCKVACTNKSDLTKHIRSHTGERLYMCNFAGCDSSFTQSSNLVRHKRTHSGDKPYKCTYKNCEAAFTGSSDLKMHTRIHTGDKPYKCTFVGCKRAFVKAKDLARHICTHTGEKPHKCKFPKCKKSFIRPDQLAKHITSAHNGRKL